MLNSMSEIKIVIVDDEPEILKTLKRILEKKDYVVSIYENPVEALNFLKSNPVDLVITDLKMPEMDGILFLMSVKEFYPSVPIILITGYATIATAVTAIQKGAYDYIRKPFDVQKIYGVVEQALASAGH